ncbi:phosphoinositide-3-kinase-interacting protein 1 isoform X1 [Caretta caretta]|uniref:phosphoinositide-3-kinase-interacting protein 1 isoform X1 n=1 Tax=Caretta caretta TaxID=8467 RepID=UPI003F4B26DF
MTESWRLPDPGAGSGRPRGARCPPPRSLLRLFLSLSRSLPRLWRGGACAAASAGSSSRGCLPQEKTTRADLPAAKPGPRRKRSEIAETSPANCSSAFAWARAGPRMLDWGQALLLSTALLTAASAAEECVRGNGVSYRGNQQFATGGVPCLNWLAVQRNSTSAPLAVSEDHSSCRNPDGDAAPWCYVSGAAGTPERSLCAIAPCPGATSSTKTLVPTVAAEVSQGIDQVFEPADTLPARSEAAAVQPVIGISQRVRMNSKEKKDLGTLGSVMAFIMMVIIIAIGAGIVVGYIYKRGKDLKEQHEQKVYEREMQRITLPLSAFTNQACELVDENTIVVHTNQTPVEEAHDGNAPLMGQAGTPGA